MRKMAAILLAVGLVWPLAGCGVNSIVPLSEGVGGGLILADSVTGAHFSLSVANGAPVLTGIGGSGTVGNSGLIDTVTGLRYGVAVTRGALTLVAGSSASGGTKQIELADTVTAKVYALAVAGGALNLIRE